VEMLSEDLRIELEFSERASLSSISGRKYGLRDPAEEERLAMIEAGGFRLITKLPNRNRLIPATAVWLSRGFVWIARWI
jgi:hypothetical protein